MLKEFREFIQRGNVMDLAVGVIIGAAFGKIVTSIVDDIIMPLIGLATGKADFVNKFIVLSSKDGAEYDSLAKAKEAGATVVAYGQFINTIVQFVIVAFSVFLMVKAVNAMRRKQDAETPEPAPPAEDVVLLTEIRDLLKAR